MARDVTRGATIPPDPDTVPPAATSPISRLPIFYPPEEVTQLSEAERERSHARARGEL